MQTSKTTAPASVTPLPVDITELTPQQTALAVVEQSTIVNRAFNTVAMLLLHLKSTLKPGQTLGGLVLKLANVPAEARRRVKSTIDNARYAMRVWEELVEPGHITRAMYTDFTFGDHLTINRAMSGASKRPLSADDVALLIVASPEDWHEQIDCLFSHGVTLDDHTAAQKSAPAATTPAASTSTPDGASEASADTAESGKATGKTEGTKTTEAVGDKPADGKVIQLPAQGTKATAEDAIKLIAALESVFVELPAAEVAKALPALEELYNLVRKPNVKLPAVKLPGKGRKSHAKAA